MPDELIDVVNDDDVVITQEMRSFVHQHGYLHRGVHVFLATSEGQLLVQQRGRHRETFPLALDCSVSEHVKAGEDYRQAADRGLAEELGIHSVRTHVVVKFKMVYGPNDFEICVLYEGSVDPTLVQFDPLEVEGIAYYRLEELEALVQSGEAVISSWFVNLIQWYLDKPSELIVIESFPHERLLFPKDCHKY
jgi:16S rRNA (adenine1518-N6/adenine1519-N6)-dimethyltransferase